MYNSLQGCRALAALFVVTFHLGYTLAGERFFGSTAAPLARIFSFGSCGVAFFFVLSGFLITLIHRKDFGRPSRLMPYLRKRLVRIYPGYIIIFSIVYLSALFFASPGNHVPHDAGTLIKSLLLVPQDKDVVGGYGAPVILVAWTLQFEMIFYCAIGLAIISRYLFAALILIFLVNYAYCAVASTYRFPESILAGNGMLLFLIGMVAAAVAQSNLNIRRPLLLAVVAGIAFFGLALNEVIFGKQTIFVDLTLAYGIISGLLIVGLVRTEDSKRNHIGTNSAFCRWMLLLADASYALYLIHWPLLILLCKVEIKLGMHGISGTLLAFVMGLAGCIFAALVFYAYVERPILIALSAPTRQSLVLHPPQKV